MTACGGSELGSQFAITPLPGGEFPAVVRAVQTPGGTVYATTADNMTRRLAAAATWQVDTLLASPLYVPNYADGQLIALSAGGMYRVTDDGFVLVPGVTPPVFGTLGTQPLDSMLGIAADQTMWALTTNLGTTTTPLLGLAKRGANDSEWTSYQLQLPSIAHQAPWSRTFTQSARVVWRVSGGGIFEADVASATVRERVACTHELFLPSHPDYAACEEDWNVYASNADDSIWILSPARELWRLLPGNVAPTRVVRGPLPGLPLTNSDGTNKYALGQSVYADPAGRVWLSFRWGNNDGDDTSFLYVADGNTAGTWSLVASDLPRNITLNPLGRTPLIASGTSEDGFLLMRVEE